mgnify:CR=1 FL=1
MKFFLFLLIGLPALEVILLIKIGGQIGTINTIMLIFFTAIVGFYYARNQGLSVFKSGIENLYKNKTPVYDLISGASIAIAAFLLIVPGFISDTIGFLILFPITRKILINFFVKEKVRSNTDVIEAEIIEEDNEKL